MELNIEEIKTNSEASDYSFKLVIIGDSGVGKTNILSRYCSDNFNQDGKATVGVELENKFFKINNNVLNVSIWDTAGQERFKSITAAYYRGAHGIIIVFDLTRKETFDNVDKWFNELKNSVSSSVKILLIGNKSDLVDLRQVTNEEAKERSKILDLGYHETSALDNENKNINKAFQQMVLENIVNKMNNQKEEDNENIKINDKVENISMEKNKQKKGCC